MPKSMSGDPVRTSFLQLIALLYYFPVNINIFCNVKRDSPEQGFQKKKKNKDTLYQIKLSILDHYGDPFS